MDDERIAISSIHDKTILVYFKNDTPTLIKAYDNEKRVACGTIINCRIVKHLDGVNGCFVRFAKDQYGFINGDYKCETVLPLMYVKDGIADKKPLFSDELEISGRYCVVKSNGKSDIKCSSKLNKVCKDKLKSYFDNLAKELNISILFRTKCDNADFEVIEDEIKKNSSVLNDIIKNSKTRNEGHVFYRPLEQIISDISEINKDNQIQIITDDEEYYEIINNSRNDGIIGLKDSICLRLYEDKLLPLHKLYRFEAIISECLSRKVYIKDNGTITFDVTEALVAIDVNSSSIAYKNLNRDETILKINILAAKEAIRQIILRNYSGIIIIDFINMQSQEAYDTLKDTLNSLLRNDVVKSKFHGFTKLGLAEISRQKKEVAFSEKMRTNNG